VSRSFYLRDLFYIGLMSPQDRQPCEEDLVQSATPLKTYACEVEDYHTTEMLTKGDKQGATQELWQHAAQAYRHGTNAFTWIVFAFVFITLSCRLFGMASQAAPPTASSALPATSPPLCEDAIECEQLFASEVPAGALDKNGFRPLPAGCAAKGNGMIAARCPRSCGLCAMVLSGCNNVAVFKPDACVEHDDVVGEVCSGDGDMKKEAYCTWMPASANALQFLGKALLGAPRSFVCAHCTDDGSRMSAERRALLAQMMELRIEEDGRESTDKGKEALERNAAAIAERDALAIHR